MKSSSILERARRQAGMSQEQLAQRSRTSRTAVSAYEHGRKSPSVDTLERLLAAAGFELGAHPRVEFAQVAGSRGRSVWAPSHLPQLPPDRALATVRLPVTVNWSQPDRVFRLADRNDRARLYEIVLSEGEPEDILRYIDGALLVDLWSELVLSRQVRQAWAPLVDAVLAAQGAA